MIFKSLFIFFFVFTAFSYEKEGNILVLKDEDFPQVINDNEYILIKFYTSWCSHCQALAPIYNKIANEFTANHSKIVFGKFECTQDENISQIYGIEGYPTFLLFLKGERINYEGQRNQFHMIKWLNKILTDPLKPINQQDYKKLEESDQSSIVFHGLSQSPQAQIIRKIAYVDEINNYYIAQPGKKQNSIQMFRPVDPTLSNELVNENIKLWIRYNQRPLVRPFDDEVIEKIFGQNITGICLFKEKESQNLNLAFKQAAKSYLKQGKEMIFTNVEKSGEHFERFGKDFLKIDPLKIAIALVDPKDGSKFVLVKNPSTLTSSDIIRFLEDWEQKKTRRYQLPDEIQKIKDQKELNSETSQQENEQNHQAKQNDEL